MSCLEDPAPLLDYKVPLFSSRREFVPAHLWIEEINTPLLKPGHSLGDASQDWRPFYCTSSLHLPLYSACGLEFLIASFSLIYKRTWHPDPNKMVFWGASLPSSGSASSPIKSLPCLNSLSLGLIGLLWGKHCEFGHGNKLILDTQ